MGLPQTIPLYSLDDYLDFERKAEFRHEYLDGQIYDMAGESLEHSTICANLIGELHGQLKGKPCRTLSPNMKVLSGVYARGQTRGLFSYPDLTVVCGAPQFHDERRDVLLNPSLIVEVLSPSTELFDRGEKFHRYRETLPSLQAYLLVSSQQSMLELYQRQVQNIWLYAAASGLDAVLSLPIIGCELSLAAVYERVEFPPTPEFPSD
jgi:Uma2 family endonuclease